MGQRVADAFTVMLNRLEPLATEQDARRIHRATIEQGVRGAYPALTKIDIIGSHTRRTAIRRSSDVDYLAILRKEDLVHGGQIVQSDTVLRNVRQALANRFPSTHTRIDGPAVVVHFDDGAGAVDVVPGRWVRTVSSTDGYPIYEIPNGEGGWIETSPQRHGAYIRDRDVAHGSRLTPVVRLLKAWKHSRSVAIPFLGFHVELLIAGGQPSPFRSFREHFRQALHVIASNSGRPLTDPLGISRQGIPLARTASQRGDVLQQAQSAAERADAAMAAEIYGNDSEAIRHWVLLFNGAFPS